MPTESKTLTQFGLACRLFRLNAGKVMADQARVFGCTASYVSALERGKKPIPADYTAKFVAWLKLTSADHNELLRRAMSEQKVIRFVPSDRTRATIATDFALALNNLPKRKLLKLHALLNGEDDEQR